MFSKRKVVKEPKSLPKENAPARIEPLETRTLLSGTSSITIAPNIKLTAAASNSSSILGYTPAQIRTAYGFTAVSGTGAGQTIAIVDAYNDPNIAADLKVFDAQFGLADPSLTVVSQTGGSVKSIATDAGWAGEISLDVEWAHAIAPGAKILLVEANSASLSDLLTAVNFARNAAGVSVVSMSWGGSEFTGEAKYDNYFTTPAGHQGVTFVASAGDSGAAAAEWPAASPNVLSVGGTTLNLTSSGAYGSESAWSSSGGGFSQVEAEPSYQTSVQSTGVRTAPDVAYNANPNTGFAVYDSIDDGGYVGWQEVGGTSAGAPQWAALIAIANQGRVAAGTGTLDGPTGTLPTLYKLYSSPNSSTYSAYTSVFNDVSTGISGGFGGGRFGQGFGTPATVGYDAVTGLGTPKAAAVVSALEGLSSRAASRALHAAHVARKLAKAAGAKGSANPGITTAANASSTASILAAEALDTAAREQIGAASAEVPVRNELGLMIVTAVPLPDASGTEAGFQVQSFAEGGFGGGSRFAGVFAVGGMGSAAESIADWTMPQPPAPLAMDEGILTTPDILSVAAGSASGPAVELMRLTPVVAFADATAAFSDECATIAAIPPSSSSAGPWAIVAAVLGLDAVLIGYWTAKRRTDRKGDRDVVMGHIESI